MYSSAHMSANRYVSKICFYLHGVVVDIFCFVDILYFNMSVGPGPGLTSALKLRRDMTVRKLASHREGKFFLHTLIWVRYNR